MPWAQPGLRSLPLGWSGRPAGWLGREARQGRWRGARALELTGLPCPQAAICTLHTRAHTRSVPDCAPACTRIDVHVRTRALSHMRTDARGTMDGQASRRQCSGQIRAPPSGQEPGTRGKWDWLETGLPDSGDAASRCWAGGPHEGRPPCLLSRKQDCSPQKVPYCSGCEAVGC